MFPSWTFCELKLSVKMLSTNTERILEDGPGVAEKTNMTILRQNALPWNDFDPEL